MTHQVMTQHAIAFSAPHAQAAEIGLDVLREGGSAVDAMIAAAAAITVLYPHMNSLAGDGFWLIHKPGAEPLAIDACGCAAGLASIDWYKAKNFAQIPSRGPLATVTMGGTLAGWQSARTITSSAMPLSRLLAPAIALASGGITVTNSLAAASRKVEQELAEQAEYRRVFMPDGRPLQEGEILTNGDLATTLTWLVNHGLEAVYHGELAEHIAAELEQQGSPLRLDDLQNYRAQVVKPLSVNTRFGRCYNLPAPTQGVASLLILAIYDRLYQSHWSETERVHGLIEATKLAFLVRDREVADPRRLSERWPELLDDEHIDQLAAVISARALPWPQVAEPGDTVWMGCVDSQGTMVSFIQSIYWEFGSGVVVPGTGLVWNNRGVGFSLDANHRNALAPGYKPFHTLNPALAVLSDGRRISYGTMGGEGQPQTQAALLTRYLYDGLSLPESISRGRWLLGRTWGDNNHDLKMERDLVDKLGENLRARGHSIKTVAAHSEMMGHAGAIVSHTDGSATAASDPRSDGTGLVAAVAEPAL
ncbi:MAG: gamma-glutamyltransferase [Cellvibrio sp.]|nr:gamma-glutamyltransferase [Cellvibrio sp.]